MDCVSYRTDVQTAILEAINSLGMFKVNWDLEESPNIRKPHVATPAYRKQQKTKLQHKEKRLPKQE